MIALWMAVFGGMILAFYMAVMQPAEIRKAVHINADTQAMQLYAYGSAINDYINAKPSFANGNPPEFCGGGGVAPSPDCLTMPAGVTPSVPANWNAWIDHGNPSGQPRIFLYTAQETSSDLLDALVRYGGGSLHIGRAWDEGGSLRLYSQYATQTAIALPAANPAIAASNMVVVWRQ